MVRRPSVCSFRPPYSPSVQVLLVAGCLLAACDTKLEARSPNDVRLIRGEPRCLEIGSVEGFGSDARHARRDAISQAALRGATHVRLDEAHPDLEDGMTISVTATMFRCRFPEQEFPPDGYR